MATQRVTGDQPAPKRRRRASNPQARENQLIALSYDAAEDMIRGGNPPAQIVSHFLKMGSERERIELEYKKEEMKLLKLKAETEASRKKTEELYVEAMDAFRLYSGQPPAPKDNDFDEDYYA